MYRLAQFSLGRRALTGLIALVVAAAGLLAMTSMRQELIPSIDYPAVAVLAVYPGASPEVVEKQVTEVVEQAAQGLDGVEQVSSTAATNVSTTTVTFAFGTDLAKAQQSLTTALSQASSRLPDGVDPRVIVGSFDQLPVMQLAVAGGSDADALARVVHDTVVPRLEQVDGVRSVTVTGDAQRQVLLDVDVASLAAAGLSPTQVTGVLGSYGVRVPAGSLTEGDQTLSVQVGTPLTSLAELEALPLTTATGAVVHLGDVVTVQDEAKSATSFSRLDGAPSLGIAITQTPDATAVGTSHGVDTALTDLHDTLAPQGVDVAVVFDQAPFITDSIDGLTTEGLLGLGFAVVVILAFLLSVRSTLVSAVSIPLSLLTAFAVMYVAGYTLNILTLAALTIAIGRVVDDSIVVIENIKRHLSYGEERRAAILGAVREVAAAITSSTLATVAVFLPIGLLGGLAGQMFRPFAFTVAIAMGASLLVALTVIPVLAYWFIKAPKVSESAEVVRAEAEAKERRGLWQRAYLPTLALALRRPVATLVIAVLVLGGTLALVPRLETNLFGDTGQDSITVSESFAPGTSLAAKDAASRTVESALLGLDEVATVQTTVGSANDLAVFGGGSADVSFAVTLAPDVDAEAASAAIRDAVSGLASDAATGISVSAGQAGFGSTTVDLVVSADDPAVLAGAAEQVRAAAAGVDGAAEVTSNLAAEQPLVQVTVDRDAVAAAGLTEAQVATTVAGLMNDAPVGTIDLDGASVEVVASFGSPPASVDQLRATPLRTPTEVVTLGELADVETVQAPSSITRLDGKRSATISVTPAGQDVGALTTVLTSAVDALDLPQGAEVKVGGVAAEQSDAFASLGLALLMAVAIVYLVLVMTFSSLGQPLILLISVPFAATGALIALLISGTALGAPALIGLLMLVGIVVSNAIVLIDLINQYRRAGRPLAEAVTEGARKRLRPIVMTAAATIFALVPMAIGLTGGGAFISQPLAVVVIGGLVSSTALTLIVVPVLYTLSQRRRERYR